MYLKLKLSDVKFNVGFFYKAMLNNFRDIIQYQEH